MQKETLRLIFGLKVHLLRQQKGMTLQQLAERTGTVVSYLHDIEKGKKTPSADKVMTLASALDTSYDTLVSIGGMKQLQPIVDLLESEFFQTYPLEMFGLRPDRILDLVSEEPARISAFVSTILKISRSYHLRKENLYMVALRAYQDMHDNYFPGIEAVAGQFRVRFPEIDGQHARTRAEPLEAALEAAFGIRVDRNAMRRLPALRRVRSWYNQEKKVLFLNSGLSIAQERFLLAREIGFQSLEISNRPFETIILQAAHFDTLLNNFNASYFASALLMPPEELAEDLRRCGAGLDWDPENWVELLQRYNSTPEMLMQRITNVLPGQLGIKDLFFLRIEGNEKLDDFHMTKELHLSGQQSPYATESGQHYCRRWVSIEILKQLRVTQSPVRIMAQISAYHQTDNAYFVMSMAKPVDHNLKAGVSVTLGLRLSDDLRRLFKFTSDPNLIRKTVGSTCETCALPDCESRAAAPVEIEKVAELQEVMAALKML